MATPEDAPDYAPLPSGAGSSDAPGAAANEAPDESEESKKQPIEKNENREAQQAPQCGCCVLRGAKCMRLLALTDRRSYVWDWAREGRTV